MDPSNPNSGANNLNIINNSTSTNSEPTNEPNINILSDDDTDDDNDNEEYGDENEDDDDEETQYEGFIPQFPSLFLPHTMGSANPFGFTFGVLPGIPNGHILNNLNNVQGIFDMMSSFMVPAIPPDLVNPINPIGPINPITNEINPANSGNSPLANTTLTGQPIAPISPNANNLSTQAMIEEEVNKLISSGTNNLQLVTKPVLDFIENCYLENMQYEDDIINIIRYTIRYCFSRRTDFEISELISGIIYYSLGGNNSVFGDNYDDVVLPMLQNELKRIVTQSVRLAILRRAIAGPTMEDVKLVVNPDVLEKIPKSKYSEVDDKIKSMNVSCTVCQDDFNTEDTVRILPCEHLYHPDCIDDWLKGHSYKCPCCRKPAAEHSAKI
jgi:hypothetical protein